MLPVAESSQIKATRGPGAANDYALFVLLLSPVGQRSVFIADWLPAEEHVEKAFGYVTHQLGHNQGYVLADVMDPAFLVKSQGVSFLDRLFAPIEAWLDGGDEPMAAMAEELRSAEAYSVTLEVEGDEPLNWRALTAAWFQPAFRRIGVGDGALGPFRRGGRPPRSRRGMGFG